MTRRRVCSSTAIIEGSDSTSTCCSDAALKRYPRTTSYAKTSKRPRLARVDRSAGRGDSDRLNAGLAHPAVQASDAKHPQGELSYARLVSGFDRHLSPRGDSDR